MPIVMEGTPPLRGRALPNLLMRSVFKSQNQCVFGQRRDKEVDFNILTA